jgi:putative cardiolipin synthase
MLGSPQQIVNKQLFKLPPDPGPAREDSARHPAVTTVTTVAPSAVLLAVSLGLSGCASLPPLDGRTASTALAATADTRLGGAVSAAARDREDESGIYALPLGKDAFAARVVLARAAERSLDVQYYIWHTDVTGFLLLEELWNAAERGVRVRMLLDDNGIAGLDPTLAVFEGHPNIEVRLYNPYPNRGFKPLGYLTDFKRLNRRMHNKSFTADTQVTIVGGRNVGDEYFGAGEATQFVDLDVMAAGRVAGEVAGAFDLYWNSGSAYPADRIVGKPAPNDVAAVKARFTAVRSSPEAVEYILAIRETRLVESLIARELRFDWSCVELLYDPPGKTLGEAQKANLLLADLKHAVGEPRRDLDIVSPYFVPGKTGTKNLSAYPESGIKLRIVTNSLAATDVSAVHAGYAKSRIALLRSGARLYELKPDAARATAPNSGQSKKGSGSSSASLHGKTLSVDRSRVFVGSFNLDPRSANLNTEMGVVIENPRLADGLSDWVDRAPQAVAYEVILTADGQGLEWIERSDQGEIRYRKEPKVGFFKRLFVKILGWLPIESML